MTLLIVNALATWYLIGLIWLVQAVHYPLLARVGTAEFAAYERAHVRRITPVVGPPMAVELATSALLALDPPGAPGVLWWWLACALSLATWGITGLWAVPCHSRLEGGFDRAAHRALMAANLVRCLAWTARGGLVAWFLLAALDGRLPTS